MSNAKLGTVEAALIEWQRGAITWGEFLRRADLTTTQRREAERAWRFMTDQERGRILAAIRSAN